MPKAATKDEIIDMADVVGDVDEMEETEALDLNFGLGEEEEDGDDPETDPEEEGDDPDEEEGDDPEPEEGDDPDGGDEADEDDAESEPDDNEQETVTDEQEVEEDVQEEVEAKKKQPMIPKSRFDEVLRKSKELEARLKAAESKGEEKDDDTDKSEAYDFDAKEREYQDLVLDGEADKAAQLRSEIRSEERKQFLAEAQEFATKTSSRSREQDALLDAARMFEEAVPQLKQGSDVYDEKLTAAVVQLRDDFIASGRYSAVEALNKAVPLALYEAGIQLEVEAPANKPAAKKVSIRKKKAVADKVKAAKAQPADLEGEGEATRDKKDINLDELTDEEFDALPARTLARLRGDIV
jgi:hypothetical protein